MFVVSKPMTFEIQNKSQSVDAYRSRVGSVQACCSPLHSQRDEHSKSNR